MGENMRWARKIGGGMLTGQTEKRKKIGKGFWAAVNYKFDSNGF
jgi:hypothetical protein